MNLETLLSHLPDASHLSSLGALSNESEPPQMMVRLMQMTKTLQLLLLRVDQTATVTSWR